MLFRQLTPQEFDAYMKKAEDEELSRLDWIDQEDDEQKHDDRIVQTVIESVPGPALSDEDIPF